MTERLAHANGIELAYETFGDPSDPALLLIMGLGTQMIGWELEFCELLVERGFHVVRFDNRDVGRSSRIEGVTPELRATLAGTAPAPPYTLTDMAADAAALLDVLDIGAAHVVGASMGGMIAQQLALDRPERVLSLCSIMSTTGQRSVGLPRPEIVWVLSESRPADREGIAAHHVRIWEAIGSPAYPADPEVVRERGRLAFDRGLSAAGYIRQVAAIVASGDRTESLRRLRLPALVIHGSADPLIDVSGGEATARAIPGARLLVFDGMGHDLPRQLWPQIVDAIAANAG